MHFHSRALLAVFGSAVLLLALTPSCGNDNNVSGAGGAGGSSFLDASPPGTGGMAGATGGTTSTSDAAPATSITVNIPPGAVGKGPAAFGTNPQIITVGTTVTWMNQDNVAHTATSDTGVFDSGVLGPGASYSFTFQQPGTFPYHCLIHGAASMSGVIMVQ